MLSGCAPIPMNYSSTMMLEGGTNEDCTMVHEDNSPD